MRTFILILILCLMPWGLRAQTIDTVFDTVWLAAPTMLAGPNYDSVADTGYTLIPGPSPLWIDTDLVWAELEPFPAPPPAPPEKYAVCPCPACSSYTLVHEPVPCPEYMPGCLVLHYGFNCRTCGKTWLGSCIDSSDITPRGTWDSAWIDTSFETWRKPREHDSLVIEPDSFKQDLGRPDSRWGTVRIYADTAIIMAGSVVTDSVVAELQRRLDSLIERLKQ